MSNENQCSGFAIWAIDPFEEKIEPHQNEVANLIQWMGMCQLLIQPIYILDLPKAQPSVDQDLDTERKLAEAHIALTKYVAKMNCATMMLPKVFINHHNQEEGAVDNLLRLSNESRAKMIVVSSRGRYGIDRFVFGSFAENLLLKSKIPLYFLTHQTADLKEQRSDKILFPTDFSAHSEKAFDLLLSFARSSNLQIILYYAITISPTIMSGDGLILIPENFYEIQELDANSSAKKWLSKANAAGVETNFTLANLGVGDNVAQEIIRLATKSAVRFIAMASSSGRIGSVFFGSVSREVFRTHFFPVWICGPRALEDEKGAMPQDSV